MKITKKQPLRPRGRSEDKRQSTKNVIRDAYIKAVEDCTGHFLRVSQ